MDDGAVLTAVRALRANRRNATAQAVAAFLGTTEHDIEGPLTIRVNRTRIIDLTEDSERFTDEPSPGTHTVHHVALKHPEVANFVRGINLYSDAEV